MHNLTVQIWTMRSMNRLQRGGKMMIDHPCRMNCTERKIKTTPVILITTSKTRSHCHEFALLWRQSNSRYNQHEIMLLSPRPDDRPRGGLPRWKWCPTPRRWPIRGNREGICIRVYQQSDCICKRSFTTEEIPCLDDQVRCTCHCFTWDFLSLQQPISIKFSCSRTSFPRWFQILSYLNSKLSGSSTPVKNLRRIWPCAVMRNLILMTWSDCAALASWSSFLVIMHYRMGVMC